MIKKSKYSNRKTILDGITFDSAKEARRYAELKLVLLAGKIKELELQPAFTLQEGYVKDGHKIRPIVYIADFKYFDLEKMQYIIEDAKGMKTDVYKIKKKIFEFKYPEFTIIEI